MVSASATFAVELIRITVSSPRVVVPYRLALRLSAPSALRSARLPSRAASRCRL